MSRPIMAGLVLVSALVGTISCVPPPRVTESEEAAARRSTEPPVDTLFVRHRQKRFRGI
jgi:thiosulfate dehydrogenase